MREGKKIIIIRQNRRERETDERGKDTESGFSD